MQTPTSNPYTVNELKQLLGYNNTQPDLDANAIWTPDFYRHLITENCFTFFTITNYANQRFLLVSPMVESVTGYPQQMFVNGGLEFMLSLVHPAEMPSLRLIHQQMIGFFNSLPQSEKSNYSYAYNVSIRKADDTYINLLCQLSYEQLANNSNLLVGKEMFTDITPFNPASAMQLIIRNHTKTSGNQNQIYRFNTSTSHRKLSVREEEVSELVARGHSSKEIATMLNRSKNTIDTYRRNIKKKKQCL
jgi:DNA-binding CsgD family transcriptional regulator